MQLMKIRWSKIMEECVTDKKSTYLTGSEGALNTFDMGMVTGQLENDYRKNLYLCQTFRKNLLEEKSVK